MDFNPICLICGQYINGYILKSMDKARIVNPIHVSCEDNSVKRFVITLKPSNK